MKSKNLPKSRNFIKAYSILEMLLVLGIFAIAAVLLVPITISLITSEKAETEAKELASAIFEYQQNAYNGKNGENYGIALSSSSYTLFIGDSLATATDTELRQLQNGVSIPQINLQGGSSELVFNSGSFRPDNPGTLTVSDGVTNFTILINPEGLVNEFKQ